MIFLRPIRSPRLPVARMLAAMHSVPILATRERWSPLIPKLLAAPTKAMLCTEGSTDIAREATARARTAPGVVAVGVSDTTGGVAVAVMLIEHSDLWRNGLPDDLIQDDETHWACRSANPAFRK